MSTLSHINVNGVTYDIGGGGKLLTIFVQKGAVSGRLFGSITITTDNGTVIVFNQNGDVSLNNHQVRWPMTAIDGSDLYVYSIVVMCNTVRVQFTHDGGAGSLVMFNEVSYLSPTTNPFDSTFTLNENTNTLYLANGWCLSPDTVISTPGGGKKLAELRVGDRVLSMDADGNLCEDEVSETDADEPPKYWPTLDRWRFSDGTVVETIHPHEFYSADERRFKYIADFRIGERVVLADGSTPALEWHESETGEFRHMTLFTRDNNTYFANGVLTGNRNSVKINKEF